VCRAVCAFVGDKNLSVVKMHGATIKKNSYYIFAFCSEKVSLKTGTVLVPEM
jgi:hypothetical protein